MYARTDLEWEKKYAEDLTKETVAEISRITGRGAREVANLIHRMNLMKDTRERTVLLELFVPESELTRVPASWFSRGRDRFIEEERERGTPEEKARREWEAWGVQQSTRLPGPTMVETVMELYIILRGAVTGYRLRKQLEEEREQRRLKQLQSAA